MCNYNDVFNIISEESIHMEDPIKLDRIEISTEKKHMEFIIKFVAIMCVEAKTLKLQRSSYSNILDYKGLSETERLRSDELFVNEVFERAVLKAHLDLSIQILCWQHVYGYTQWKEKWLEWINKDNDTKSKIYDNDIKRLFKLETTSLFFRSKAPDFITTVINDNISLFYKDIIKMAIVLVTDIRLYDDECACMISDSENKSKFDIFGLKAEKIAEPFGIGSDLKTAIEDRFVTLSVYNNNLLMQLLEISDIDLFLTKKEYRNNIAQNIKLTNYFKENTFIHDRIIVESVKVFVHNIALSVVMKWVTSNSSINLVVNIRKSINDVLKTLSTEDVYHKYSKYSKLSVDEKRVRANKDDIWEIAIELFCKLLEISCESSHSLIIQPTITVSKDVSVDIRNNNRRKNCYEFRDQWKFESLLTTEGIIPCKNFKSRPNSTLSKYVAQFKLDVSMSLAHSYNSVTPNIEEEYKDICDTIVTSLKNVLSNCYSVEKNNDLWYLYETRLERFNRLVFTATNQMLDDNIKKHKDLNRFVYLLIKHIFQYVFKSTSKDLCIYKSQENNRSSLVYYHGNITKVRLYENAHLLYCDKLYHKIIRLLGSTENSIDFLDSTISTTSLSRSTTISSNILSLCDYKIRVSDKKVSEIVDTNLDIQYTVLYTCKPVTMTYSTRAKHLNLKDITSKIIYYISEHYGNIYSNMTPKEIEILINKALYNLSVILEVNPLQILKGATSCELTLIMLVLEVLKGDYTNGELLFIFRSCINSLLADNQPSKAICFAIICHSILKYLDFESELQPLATLIFENGDQEKSSNSNEVKFNTKFYTEKMYQLSILFDKKCKYRYEQESDSDYFIRLFYNAIKQLKIIYYMKIKVVCLAYSIYDINLCVKYENNYNLDYVPIMPLPRNDIN